MGQLDKLIERLQPEQEIVLETGKEPMLRTDAGLRIMVNQQLQTPQIIALLSEIAPGGHKEHIARKRQTNFEYFLNNKVHNVTYMPQGEQVRIVISLAGKNGEDTMELVEE